MGLLTALGATFVTYLCVSGSSDLSELIVGLIVSALATVAVIATVRLAGIRQRVEIGSLPRLWRSCTDIVTQIVPLTLALVSGLTGRRPLEADTERRAFDPGASEDPKAAGRRALVSIGLSVSPASLICERDLDCNELIVASVGLKAPARDAVDPCWPL